MFNRSEIPAFAWKQYRSAVKRGLVGKNGFDRKGFGYYLRFAWECAKATVAQAKREAIRAAGRIISERETVLRNQLLGIECAERMDWTAYNAVNAELSQLRAA